MLATHGFGNYTSDQVKGIGAMVLGIAAFGIAVWLWSKARRK